MKKPTAFVRASHLNAGTGIPEEELAWPETSGRVMRLPGLQVEVADRSTVTPYGGLALASAFLRRFRVAQAIDERVQVLKLHLPYHESDHVIAQALNLYAGGTCIEDQAALQNDEGVLRMLGACRIPDPTTAGDFLRRFEERRNRGSLAGLRSAIDTVQDQVWGKLAGKKRRKRDWAVVDLDGHTKTLYGVQKDGADFDRKGRWSYNVLLASLAGTGECLAVRNRSGNVRSSNGAAELLDETLPRVKSRFAKVLVRADSDFDRVDVREACEAEGAFFAFVAREATNRLSWAEAIPESAWKPFRTRAHREQQARRARVTLCRGARSAIAGGGARGSAATPTYSSCASGWRRSPGRRSGLGEDLSHDPPPPAHRRAGWPGSSLRVLPLPLCGDEPPDIVVAVEVIDATYQRCDQENVIEQMGSGVALWRMPVAEFDGNSAWLEIGRLAWNLGKWIAQLALPAEVVRWEWKRYRQAFVYLAVEVSPPQPPALAAL